MTGRAAALALLGVTGARSPSAAAAATAASAATTARCVPPTACGALRYSVRRERRTPRDVHDADAAPAPSADPKAPRRDGRHRAGERARARGAGRASASVRAWRRAAARSSTSRRWPSELGRPDQLDLPGGRPAPARRRPLRETTEPTSRRRIAAGALRRRRVPRPPGGRPPGHGRHPLRAARLRARRARAHRSLQRRRRTRTRCTSPTACSGATTTRCRSFPARGSASARPSWICDDVASAWREWPFVAARSQAPPDTSYAVVPCDRTARAGFNNPTLTAAGVPLTTTLPGDGIHFERFIIATPGAGPGAGASARRCASARWFTASRRR